LTTHFAQEHGRILPAKVPECIVSAAGKEQTVKMEHPAKIRGTRVLLQVRLDANLA
jgi:hypothetical protein